jgi:hypothetical protein
MKFLNEGEVPQGGDQLVRWRTREEEDEAMRSFAERLKQAKVQRLPNGKLYADADLKDWQVTLAVHHARGREVSRKGYANSSSELAWKQQDGNYRYYLGMLNEDRQSRGLPLIVFE